MGATSLPEWITAIATCVATIAASLAGVVAYRAYTREVLRESSADAAGFHAWFAWDTSADRRGQCLVLVNVSNAPVYDVALRGVLNDVGVALPREGKTWQVIPPGSYVVRPDETYGWSLPDPVATTVGYRPYTRSAKHRVSGLEFRDAAGRLWVRNETGALRSLGS